MQKIETVQKIKSKTSQNLIKKQTDTITSNESIYGGDIPKMKLLNINYVKPNSNLNYRQRQCDNSNKPSLYKYAVYKKFNERYNNHPPLSQSLFKNNEHLLKPKSHADREDSTWNFQKNRENNLTITDNSTNYDQNIIVNDRNKSLIPRSLSTLHLDNNEFIDCGTEKSDSWNFRLCKTKRCFQRSSCIPGIKTRANRIQQIEKLSHENNNQNNENEYRLQKDQQMIKVKSRPLSDSNISRIFVDNSDESKMFSIESPSPSLSSYSSTSSSSISHSTASSSSKSRNDKIKRLKDDFHNVCYCKKDKQNLESCSKSSSSYQVLDNMNDELLNKNIQKLFDKSSQRCIINNDHNKNDDSKNSIQCKMKSQSYDRKCPENSKIYKKYSDSSGTKNAIDSNVNNIDVVVVDKTTSETNQNQIGRIQLPRRASKKRRPLLTVSGKEMTLNELFDQQQPKTKLLENTCTNLKSDHDDDNINKNFDADEIGERNTCGYKNCTFSNCPMSPMKTMTTISSCVLSNEQQQDMIKDQKKIHSNGYDSNKCITHNALNVIDGNNCSNNNYCNVSKSTSNKKTNILIANNTINNNNSDNMFSTEEISKGVKVCSSMTVVDDNRSVTPYNCGKINDEEDQRPLQLQQSSSSSPSSPSLIHQIRVKSMADLNDVQNFSGKNLTKATTSELLLNSSTLNNIVVKNQKLKCDIDVNLKNNENRKFNDLRSGIELINNESCEHYHRYQQLKQQQSRQQQHFNCHDINDNDNEIDNGDDDHNYNDGDVHRRNNFTYHNCNHKYQQQEQLNSNDIIMKRNASPSSNYSTSSDISSLSDSEKDVLYLNHCCTGSLMPFNIHSSTNRINDDHKGRIDDIRQYQINNNQNNINCSNIQQVFPFPTKLGCDGAIFWNNCYFYDETTYCIDCSDLTKDYRIDMKTGFSCSCNTKRIDNHDIRPRSMEGAIDSGVSINGDIGSSPDSDISGQNLQSQSDLEARRLKRGHVLTELLETERIYVTEMSSILKGYRDAMLSDEMAPLVPPSLQGKEDILFGNLEELYTFHSEVFLKDLENCISTTELVALCFVQRRDTFYRLYSFYCQNIPRSERLRETLVDTHLFLQECQKRLGHKLPLAAYLLKPVQRITKYQLLLKDLLRFSDSGTCTKELQKALDCMLIVLKCVNDSMHQIAITGFPADLSQQGELLLQDSFQVWTESKKDIRLRLKTQQRHIFLYQKAMLFCKQSSKTGHNKSTYQFKHYLKMSQIGLTESVRGDPRRFEVWLQGRQEVHTLQAPNIEIKNKWVSEIKRVLLNQLEELKGEKIKQYGLNHRQLRQTVSWDTPCSLLSTPQRTISCDAGNNDLNRFNTPSSNSNNSSAINSSSGGNGVGTVNPTPSVDECQPQPTPPGGVSLSSTSDKDNQEVSGWSSDYSNSEDELSIIEDNSTPGSRFIALADYCAVGHSEVSMKEGDIVELLKVGCAGWWFVKILDSNIEGWTPAAYLEPINNRKTSRSSSRNQDRLN